MDFTNLPIKKKAYGGANGSKLSVVLNNDIYMLKLPSRATKNKGMPYSNSCVSEYLGSHIFNFLGIPAQETILGSYEYHGVNREVVACKDFCGQDWVVQDFVSVKNQIIDSVSNGYGTELSDILETIENQHVIDPKILSDFFWDLFVVDAFIGNWDRHNGNWGFLYNGKTDSLVIAPVFDCGSSLFPQIDEASFKKILLSKAEMRARIFDVPTSAITDQGKRINYYQFIKSHKYKECDDAVARILPKIDLVQINQLIDSVESISLVHKEFLKKILLYRKEVILMGKVF